MKKYFQKISTLSIISIGIVIGSLVIGLGVNIAIAEWASPTVSPPGGEIAAPINISSVNQYKAGGLQLGGTTGPGSFKLDVQGNAEITGRLEIKGNIRPTAGTGTQTLGNINYNWYQLWLNQGGYSGIVFKTTAGGNAAAFQYDQTSPGKFKFLRDTTELMTLSDVGELWAKGSAIIGGGLTVDTSTLVVSSSEDWVGIGATVPTDDIALEVAGTVGDTNNVIVGDKLTIGSSNFAASTNLSIGTYVSPIAGIGLWANSSDSNGIIGYSAGTNQYGVYGLAAAGTGVFGYGVSGTGVSGQTDLAAGYGVKGINTEVGSSIDQGIGMYGEGASIGGVGGAGADSIPTEPGTFSTAIFGNGGGLSGTYADHFNSFGVYGAGGNIDQPPDGKNIYTYGVYGKAGNITDASDSSDAQTYGVFGEASTSVDPDAVSYAGWFEGDTVINGDALISGSLLVGASLLTIDDAAGKIGIGESSPDVKLHVQADDGQAAIYGIAGNTGTAAPTGPQNTSTGVYGMSGAPTSGYNFGVYGKAGASNGGYTIGVAGIANNSGTNTYAGAFSGPVIITNYGSALGTLSVAGDATINGDLKNLGGLEVINGSTGATCTGAQPSSFDQGTMFICRHCMAVPGARRYELMIRVGDAWIRGAYDDYGTCS